MSQTPEINTQTAGSIRRFRAISIATGLALVGCAVLLWYHPHFAWNRGLFVSQGEIIWTGIMGGLLTIIVGIALPGSPNSERVRTARVFAVFAIVMAALAVFVFPALRMRGINSEESLLTSHVSSSITKPGNRSLFFAATGDTAYEPAEARAVAMQMAKISDREPLDSLLLLGDNLSDKGEFGKILNEQFLEPFRPVINREIPIYGALGNHDYASKHMEGEITEPFMTMQGRRFYSKKFGDNLVEFFVLDSEVLRGDPDQIVWLRAALSQSTAQWKILLLHHPLEATEILHGPSTELSRILEPILEGPNGVQIVLAGHNHWYERRKLVDGILHVTAGLGCSNNHRVIPADAERVTYYNDRPGFITLRIDGNEVELKGFNDRGEQFDQVRLRQHDSAGRHTLEIIKDDATSFTLPRSQMNPRAGDESPTPGQTRGKVDAAAEAD